MNVSSTIGGLAGACALTLLNESIKKIDKNAPRLDLLGQNALAKLMKGNTMIPQTAEKLFPLAGDLVTNSLFYGMARGSSKSNTLIRGLLLGLGAGVGAVTLPKQFGLPQQQQTTNTNPSKNHLMTVAWYVIGGLIAAAVINAIDKSPVPENKELKSGAINAGKEVVKDIASRK